MRAQANLLALAAAVVVVSAALGVALLFVGGSLSAATGDPGERVLATGVADRLVAADGPLTRGEGTLNASRVENFSGQDLAMLLANATDARVRISLDGEVLATRGNPRDGTTVTRLVRVVEHRTVIRRPDLSTNESGDDDYVLRAAHHVEISINGSAGILETVWLDGRLVLHDPDGLDGTFTVRLPAPGQSRVQFAVSQPGESLVTLETVRRDVELRRLVVTVDA